MITIVTYCTNPTFCQSQNNDTQESLKFLFELNLHKSDSISNQASSPATKAYLKHYQLFVSEMVLNNQHDDNYNETFNQLTNTIDNNNNKYRYLYLSEIYLQRGILEYKQDNKLMAIRSFLSAYNNWEKSNEAHPDLKENLKLEGIFNLLIGNLPPAYSHWANWFGYPSNVNKGFLNLQQHIKNQTPLTGTYDEALLYSAFAHLKFSLNNSDTKRFILHYNNNNLPQLLQSIFIRCAFKIREPELCNNLFNSTKNDFAPLLYLKGKYAVLYNDEKAPIIIRQFLNTKNISFQADALRYLSWHYLLRGDTTSYSNHQNDILNLKKYPTSKDKQALFESKLNEIPNITLLKARLLFDRGDYAQTIHWLKENTTRCTLPNEKIEYHYRLGRSHQAQNSIKQALKEFVLAIEQHPSSSRYFGPYAAIQSAKIYLAQNDTTQANTFLIKAAAINKGEYKYTIEQEISRMQNKIAKQ